MMVVVVLRVLSSPDMVMPFPVRVAPLAGGDRLGEVVGRGGMLVFVLGRGHVALRVGGCPCESPGDLRGGTLAVCKRWHIDSLSRCRASKRSLLSRLQVSSSLFFLLERLKQTGIVAWILHHEVCRK